MKINPLLLPILQRIAFIFIHKQFGSRQPEPVNTLFYVPYHKNIIVSLPYAGYAGQNRFLNQVAVLILVNHDLRKLLLIFLRHIRRRKLSIYIPGQNPQGILLHIIKINHTPAAFLVFKSRHKIQRKLYKHFYIRPAHLKVCKDLLSRLGKIQRADILHRSFYLFPDIFHQPGFLRRYLFVSVGGQSGPFDRLKGFAAFLIPFPSHKSFYHKPVRLQHFLIHIRSFRLIAYTRPLFQKFRRSLQIPSYIFFCTLIINGGV